MRKKLLIANWKLNHNQSSARDFFLAVLPKADQSLIATAIAPTAPMLGFCSQYLAGHQVALAAQNVFYIDSGAYTGEWSALQLAELKVKYCIVGHSERRRIFFESDEQIEKKATACLRAKITPVACVGESEQERDEGKTEAVIKKQVQQVLLAQKAPDQEIIIAYEPVWAIGTGKTATSHDVQMVHQKIRSWMADMLGEEQALRHRIIYGGSVTPLNIGEFCRMPDIDGALVGGASLQAASFLSMVDRLRDIGPFI